MVHPVRIGLIVDDRSVTRWQAEGLLRLRGRYDVILYSCTNSRPGLRSTKHALYYLLNLCTIRNRWTQRIPLPSDFPLAGEVGFEAGRDGAWQVIPDWLLDRIAEDDPAVILKFGMGLLRVAEADRLAPPILSFHHGDPRSFRGRPAGFYEMLEGADRLGQVVQVLSNHLDAGDVAAFAETRIHTHSYRKTLIEAFSVSPLLVEKAITNVLSRQTARFQPGKSYRLPSNRQVIAFCSKLLRNAASRLFYGAFLEKRWRVARAEAGTSNPSDAIDNFPPIGRWEIEPTPRGYAFLADPFFHPGGRGFLAEGLSKSTSAGAILHVVNGETTPLSDGHAHWSYPATHSQGGAHFLIPEMSEAGPAGLFRLTDNRLERVAGFSVEGNPRLIDPTLFPHEGRFYLFANRLEEGPGVLRLWVSEELAGHYNEHPKSPVRISPAGSRMAGNIVSHAGSLWRFGQDFTAEYGNGIFLFEIESLSALDYREVECSRRRFAEVRGPHTVNFNGSQILFDFYTDRLSALAGLRRLISFRRSRRHARLSGRTDHANIG
nr:hypothetical protein [Sphingomonas sp.]